MWSFCTCKSWLFQVLLTCGDKFYLGTSNVFHFFNFLAWYEVEICAGDFPWQVYLFDDVIHFNILSSLKTICGLLIRHLSLDQVVDVVYHNWTKNKEILNGKLQKTAVHVLFSWTIYVPSFSFNNIYEI